MHWVGARGAADLAFDYCQRDTIHEEDDVRDDALLNRTRRVDTELVDGRETVALRMSKVDQRDHGVRFAGELVPVHLCLEEERLNEFIGFQQRASWLAKDLVP